MGKKLRLSRNNKIFAGVCGGIAEYFNVDPTLIRVIWVIVSIIMSYPLFLPFVIYIICWAVMPLQESD